MKHQIDNFATLRKMDRFDKLARPAYAFIGIGMVTELVGFLKHGPLILFTGSTMVTIGVVLLLVAVLRKGREL